MSRGLLVLAALSLVWGVASGACLVALDRSGVLPLGVWSVLISIPAGFVATLGFVFVLDYFQQMSERRKTSMKSGQ